MKQLLAGVALGVTVTVAAVAGWTTMNADHAGMDHGSTAVTDPATAAFIEANKRMHSAMAITYSGNADIDFAKGMIPHHKGAIDMAKIVLEHGSDPEIRKLAEEIIAAQEGEIAWMQAWLARNGQ